MMGLDFVPIWTAILGIGVLLYVLLDGFGLGVGILSRHAPDAEGRNLMVSSIAPVWGGNETWLILSGVALFAAFPLAFAVIVPALYFPVLMMLVGLIFRGVAFEYRTIPGVWAKYWDFGFYAGSVLAAFAQGVMLGSFVTGFAVAGRNYAGGSFDWVDPFPIVAGVALVFGYGLLGAGWLVLKTQGALQAWARRQGRRMFLGVIAFIALVTALMLLWHPQVTERWLAWPNALVLWPVPAATVLAAWWTWRAFGGRGGDAHPFIATAVLFAVSYGGLAISFWPMIVPYEITLWEASASPRSQAFLLVGTLLLLPIILTYTAWSYWVFRGKVRADIGYGGH
jgi:cytochrome bd ubiquinol oxidase subunit II